MLYENGFSPGEVDVLDIPIPALFRTFNRRGEFTVYERYLPHWRQEEATYFVTFRTGDSVPAEIGREMKVESDEWREINSRALNGDEGGLPEGLRKKYEKFQRRTFTKLESLLDSGVGECALRRPDNRTLMAESLLHFDGERYDLFGAVIMPNHVHVLVRPGSSHVLSTIVGAWKSFTSRHIAGRATAKNTFWQAESYDRIIRDEDHYRKAVRYILKNPGTANLPLESCWLWSCNVRHPLIQNPENYNRLKDEP